MISSVFPGVYICILGMGLCFQVEQIAQMKPKGTTQHDTGMLEFLEDIIGSSRFQEPIDLLKRRVGHWFMLKHQRMLKERNRDSYLERIPYLRTPVNRLQNWMNSAQRSWPVSSWWRKKRTS